MDLFDPKLPFFKGNLHCHTTVSDGKLSPDEVVALYRDLGYDFLALTDHRRLSAPTHLEGCMLLLSGMEMDYTLPGEVLHLIGVGMDERLNGYDLSEGPQRCINLFPLLTAEENVCYPLRLRKEDKDQALALARQRLADMGIRESYFRKLPNQLSGGEQQRVAIARALAAGSYVILADEPTGNLDSGNSRMIVETLQRLAHQEKRCVIVVTHDPAVAAAADVQLRMQDGRLTQEEQQAEA